MEILAAQEIYSKLINEDCILTLKGQIQFHLGGVGIVVRQKDVVGNIIQEWLQGWMEKRGIAYTLNSNSQMPPDFFLNPNDKTRSLLEVKAFNRDSTPGFDIADFRMYSEEIIEKPYMLDADYLIFGYRMNPNGVVTIKDLWLKKVWQITRRMGDWPLNLQVKAKVVHKIRPGVWYRTPNKFKMFESLEDFISAVNHTVWQNPKTKESSGTWLVNFIKAYKSFYGKRLRIPHWEDIEDKYLVG